jgi:hypothetical protein
LVENYHDLLYSYTLSLHFFLEKLRKNQEVHRSGLFNSGTFRIRNRIAKFGLSDRTRRDGSTGPYRVWHLMRVINWKRCESKRPSSVFGEVTIGMGARVSVVGWDIALQAGRSRVRFPMRSLDFFFQLTYSFQPHYGPGVDSSSNRNEYQESSWG